MTRGWWVAALPLAAACAASRMPWVVEPESTGACSPAAIAAGSCFPISEWQDVLLPPMVVGPGRFQVVTRVGLRGVAARPARREDYFRFVVDEITRAGDQRLAEGSCPGGHPALTQPIGLARLPSGETGIACLENGTRDGCVPGPQRVCTPVPNDDEQVPGEPVWDCPPTRSCDAGFVHFGVIDRASHTIAWRWRVEVAFGLGAKDVRFAAVGDRVAIVYEYFRLPPVESGWSVVFGPADTFAKLPAAWEPGALTTMVAAGDDLKLIFKRPEHEMQYQEVTIGRGGATSLVDLEQRGRVTPGEPREPCLAEDTDGTLMVSLPYDRGRETDESPPPLRGTLTLRYPKAITAQGPDVYPASRASCAPRIAGRSAEWTRASFDAVGPVIVYMLDGGPGYPPSLRVDRRAR